MPSIYDEQIALFIGEDRYEKAMQQDGTRIVKDNIMHSHLNYDIMKKCAKSMGIDDIRSYYRPTHGNMRLTFRSLKQELSKNRDMGSKTLLLVYFSGYGNWDSPG